MTAYINGNAKPCPFCGKMPFVIHHDRREGYQIKCDNPFCPAMPESIIFDSEQLAISAWNIRPETPCHSCSDCLHFKCKDPKFRVTISKCEVFGINMSPNDQIPWCEYFQQFDYDEVER